MNRKSRRLSAAALALLFCLSAIPATAKPGRDRSGRDRFEVREPIVKVIKKIRSFLDRLTAQDELTPPHPRP